MSVWVLYFVAQVALIRSKNIKLHMTMGMAGIGLAVLAIVTGLAAAYNAQLIEGRAPGGLNPHSFFLIPVGDMLLFVIFFAGAIYYRKRPAEHKGLMLMTAINFLPPALARIPVVPPEFTILWAFGLSSLIGVSVLVYQKSKHGKINRVFAAALLMFIVALPLTDLVFGYGNVVKFHRMAGVVGADKYQSEGGSHSRLPSAASHFQNEGRMPPIQPARCRRYIWGRTNAPMCGLLVFRQV